MKENFIVKAFESLAKFFYALLPAVLPYSTPLPIAMITASSAETFFNMTPWVAGVFVFSLEGLGVWSTTALVDRVVEWVRSRNPKVAWTVFILFAVVSAYITILILLNVVLKGDKSTAYKAAVTLVCFLPFIAGILNGFHKVSLKDQDNQLFNLEIQNTAQEKQWEHEARLRREEQEFKLKKLSMRSQAHKTSQEILTPSRKVLKTSYPVSPLEEKIFSLLDDAYKKEKRILAGHELVKRGFDKTTAFRYRLKWLRQNNLIDK